MVRQWNRAPNFGATKKDTLLAKVGCEKGTAIAIRIAYSMPMHSRINCKIIPEALWQ